MKTHIPQDGKKLRELRQAQQYSQTDLAERLLKLLKPHMRPGFLIQQPDITRLELENTPIDIVELLAYSHVFGVAIDQLLKPQFRALHTHAFRLQQFTQDADVDRYLTELESEQRILVYSQFPSSFFIAAKPESSRFQQIAQANYPETHIHTLDALLNFLFSPVNRYSVSQRQDILDRYLEHFRHRHSKHLRFFSQTLFSPTSAFPNLVLLPAKSMLLMLAPLMQHTQGDVFLEIHDEQMYQQVSDFYFHHVPLLEADIALLRIGREALELLRSGAPLEQCVQFFCEKVAERSPEDAPMIRANLMPTNTSE